MRCGPTGLRTGIFSTWATVLYIVGFLPLSIEFFIPNIIGRVSIVVGSIGFIWLSYALWSGASEPARTPEVAM
jgi:hypothetical protein